MAAAYNYFRGLSEAELLDARKKVQRAILAGNKLVAFGAGDVSGSELSEFQSDWCLRQIEVSLNAINAVTYPLQRPITRAKVAFS